jgi:hypothetical protein
MAFDARAFLTEQFDFSDKTFGPGQRSEGVLAHIAKELLEIEQDPFDRVEWIDVVLLANDGTRRAGHSLDAMLEQWPGGPLVDWEITLNHRFEQAAQGESRNGSPLEVLPLIRANMERVRQDPSDLEAWLNITALAFEGGRRTGANAAELLETLAAKFARNQSRVWPDWRGRPVDRPIEHDRSHD